MPHLIDCPNCSKRYQVADSNRGKRVCCTQCGTVFSAATAMSSSQTASDPLAAADYPPSSAAPGSVPLHGEANPFGTTPYSAPGRYAVSAPQVRNLAVSNSSGGPSDAKMRLGACGMLAFGIVLILISLALEAFTGTIYVALVALAPLMFVLGIATLISPNSVRAIGKYGGHLPSYYKFFGWGLIVFSVLSPLLVMFMLFLAGYEPDVPRPRRQFQRGNPGQAAQAQPPTKKAEQKNDPGVTADPNAMKPRKSYPVSITVPPDSQFVPADARLQAGTKLQACWLGKWNPITTLSENEDGSLNVHWDDFEAYFECSMVRNELIIKKEVLRQLGHIPIESSKDEPPRPEVSKDSDSVAAKPLPFKNYPVTIAVPPDSQFVPADALLQAGTKLQACWSGKWNPITLLSENQDGTLAVRWDDFGAAYDCNMSRNELIIKNEVLD